MAEEDNSFTDKQRENSETKARRLANLKPFKPGQSGNPKGRPKSIVLSEAYRKHLAKVDESDPERRTYAEVLAEQMIVKAKAGDVGALREIADRTEGKAKQTIALTLEKREQIERAIDKLMGDALASGDEVTREQAIEALSIFMPEASQLVN
jgi:hypothetical protein